MSGFSPEWLALREPVDLRARNTDVLVEVTHYCARFTAPHITDLASGTGSTLRALQPHLPGGQIWRLTDYDKVLIERAHAMTYADYPKLTVETLQCDLSKGIEPLLDDPVDLLTTSGFLDLVSASWLDALVDAVVARIIPFYATLSYDGRIAMTPLHPLDQGIIEAVNAHQKGDKGFGPALGPDAAAHAINRFEQAGYTVHQGRSDWAPRKSEDVFQRELITGWAQAASETTLLSPNDIGAWLIERLGFIEAGTSKLTIGHVDFLACPED